MRSSPKPSLHSANQSASCSANPIYRKRAPAKGFPEPEDSREYSTENCDKLIIFWLQTVALCALQTGILSTSTILLSIWRISEKSHYLQTSTFRLSGKQYLMTSHLENRQQKYSIVLETSEKKSTWISVWGSEDIYSSHKDYSLKQSKKVAWSGLYNGTSCL